MFHPIARSQSLRRLVATVALPWAALACAGNPAPAPAAPATRAADAEVSAPIRPQPYTKADVHFMTGMIRHHAQAVLMAGWAPTHGAGEAVRTLCARIVVGQRDEIAIMQRWLRDRGEPVPDADASHDMMPGMSHDHLMPGMLTAEQLRELDAARGEEFDRLFLTYMIVHHKGAVLMVDNLMGSYGAAQEDVIFKLASDINADQSTEIERMGLMLLGVDPGRS